LGGIELFVFVKALQYLGLFGKTKYLSGNLLTRLIEHNTRVCP
jgi:hypothetical protein